MDNINHLKDEFTNRIHNLSEEFSHRLAQLNPEYRHRQEREQRLRILTVLLGLVVGGALLAYRNMQQNHVFVSPQRNDMPEDNGE